MKADVLREKVLSTIGEHEMLMPGCRVLVALSGGADSVALLHVLLSVRQECGIQAVEAAHIHHGLRGAEADRDENFVRQLCEKWDVKLYVTRVDVAALAAAQHMGLEETGRQVRYAYLESVPHIDRIATAHTATDNAETLLLHMTRGCGLRGLTCIAPVRGRLVHPLLTCSREEVEAYCDVHDLCYVTDSTNADVQYARNRVRCQVLPALKALNPALEETLTRMTVRCTQDAAFLDQQAKSSYEALTRDGYGRVALTDIKQLPPAIRSRVWMRLLEDHDLRPGNREIDRLDVLLDTPGAVTLSPECRVSTSETWLEIARHTPASDLVELSLVPGEVWSFGSATYRFARISVSEMEMLKFVHKNVLFYACDYDKIGRDLRATIRREGDSLRPVGRGCRKTLKKLFNELRVPVALRERTPVLRDEVGVVMVPGFACDERVSITESTQMVALFCPIEWSAGERNGKDEQYT